MEFPGEEVLLELFHRSKTELSCMENPHTFIRQLRDYRLIPEEFYKKVNRKRNKKTLKNDLYDILDWMERKRSQDIKVFWRCVFKEAIVNEYPTLQQLRKSLNDGSSYLDETDARKRKEPSENENVEERQEIQVSSMKKKQKNNNVNREEEEPSQSCRSSRTSSKGQEETTARKRKPLEKEGLERREEIQVSKKKKQNNYTLYREEEQPSQSSASPMNSPFIWIEEEETDVRITKEPSKDENVESSEEITASKKKKKHKIKDNKSEEEVPSSSKKTKLRFSSPIKGKGNDIWTWPLYKYSLPVTCGNMTGTLNRDRLRKGKPSILVNKEWITPNEFQRRGGKASYKNWKMSIRCVDTPLAKLLETGHLQTASVRGRGNKVQKSLFATDKSTDTDSEHEILSDEEAEVQEEGPSSSNDSNSDRSVFNVTCGELAGKLHRKRFATGNCGLSIRTNSCWMTPADFVKEALDGEDASWKKELILEGRSLDVVLNEKVLQLHSLLCNCKLCKPTDGDLDEQKNDDECCVCKSEGDLVVCDSCPRSFHPNCHLPHIDNNILSDNKTWKCTFCIFSAFKEWRYSDELESSTVLSKQISKHMLECHYLLLYLFSLDDEQFFATNPCGYLKDYTSVVKTPMWLCKIEEKLQKNEYCLISDFVSDVELLFSNCVLYNKNNPHFFSMGARLKQLFDEEFKSAF
ncbi:nuclear body protein SP140-like protein [Corythoichthys intestinalis]|uniref:nuclear body protein SP140-like protein n=1 Tax=Corythoichthys intestinalis TaxID=161448 RepID=UPI0025A5B17D|nr:nuclear body protein SP140-like protein [Corythoichthys intestinalis]